MSDLVYNSPFEVSLRLLLSFSVKAERWLSSDMVAALDFIAIYAASFGIDNKNLNGDGGFKFSEYAARRTIVHDAIKRLVIIGALDVIGSDEGFIYRISKDGLTFARRLETSYAKQYRIAVEEASERISGMSEKETIALINKTAINALRKGEF